MNAHPVSRGLTAGLLAAATFAVWFLLVDLMRGQPLATPAYLSGLVFSYTTALPATARLATFTLVHFAAFGLVGVLVAVLLERWRVPPRIYLGVVLGFLLFGIAFYGSVLVFGVDVVKALGWPQVLSGNLLAGAVMFAYLRSRSGAPAAAR